MHTALILSKLAEVARPEILKDFRADSCIASTHIVIRVLKHFKLLYEPSVVRVHIYNPEFVRQVQAGNLPPKNGSIHAWCEQTGAWSIGLGMAEGDRELAHGKWPGHLVALGVASRTLVDASLNQCDRPQHGIIMPSVFIATVTPAFVEGCDQVTFAINECIVVYGRVLDGPPFKHSPDWRDHKRVKRAVKAIIKYIEA